LLLEPRLLDIGVGLDAVHGAFHMCVPGEVGPGRPRRVIVCLRGFHSPPRARCRLAQRPAPDLVVGHASSCRAERRWLALFKKQIYVFKMHVAQNSNISRPASHQRRLPGRPQLA
jgi:hypothetical protein